MNEICNMDCLNCIHPDCINAGTDLRAYRAEWIARYRQEHPEYVARERARNSVRRKERREERRAAGLCYECGKRRPEKGQMACSVCQQKNRIRRANLQERRRENEKACM